jgi:hypothetical protein
MLREPGRSAESPFPKNEKCRSVLTGAALNFSLGNLTLTALLFDDF